MPSQNIPCQIYRIPIYRESITPTHIDIKISPINLIIHYFTRLLHSTLFFLPLHSYRLGQLRKKLSSKLNNFILDFYLHSPLTHPKTMVSSFPRTSRLSCPSFILPSVAVACFWLVVVCKLVNRQPSMTKILPISLNFLQLYSTPQTMGH